MRQNQDAPLALLGPDGFPLQAEDLVVPRPMHPDRHGRDLEFLSRSALEFAQLGDEHAIITYTTRRVSDLVGHAVVIGCGMDRASGRLQMCEFSDPERRFAAFPPGIRLPEKFSAPPLPLAVHTFALGRLVRVPGGIDVLTFGFYSPEEARLIEKAIGYRESFCVGLAHGEEIHGTLSIIAFEDTVMPDPRIIETFAAQATMALRQRRTEASLAESERRFRRLVEQLPQAVVEVDPEGRVTYANPHTWIAVGADPGLQLVGEDLLQWIAPEDRPLVMRNHKRLLGGDVILGEEFWILRRDGSRCRVSVYANPIVENGRVVGTRTLAIDITERVEAERARRLAEARLQHAERLEALAVLAGGLAHDFNNLFVAILGNAELALSGLKPGSAAYGRVQRIERAARRAAELTGQLLDYSGGGHARLETVQIEPPVTEALAVHDDVLRAAGTLRVDIPPDLPPIEGDAAQVRQVVSSLLVNAAEALGEGGGTITVRAGLMHGDDPAMRGAYLGSDLLAPEYVYVEVEDTGPGMDDVTRQRVFDPFFTTKFPGRGLGLAAVLGIIRAHRGAITVRSEPGKGTAFRALFRVARKE